MRASTPRCGSACAPTAPRSNAAYCCARSATCCTGCRRTASTRPSWTCWPTPPAPRSGRPPHEPRRRHVGRPADRAGHGAPAMRLTRAWVDLPLSAGARFELPEAAATHLVRVLRLREGDGCVLFNGDGRDHRARIVEAGKRRTVVEVLDAETVDNESPLRITLLQGIARGEKMDLILQKATELGVARIVPLRSERSEVRLEGERLARRLEHWRAVVVAACEQSGRARLPELLAPVPVSAIAGATAQDQLRLTLDPR